MFMNNNIVSANYELCAINFLFAFILAIFSKLIMTLEPRKNTRTIYTNHTTFKIECNV